MATKDPLRFKVASHIVQDLGLNLYTSLPRVLVEFVANAYDADSPHVAITLDMKGIDKQRKAVKADFDREKALATEGDDPAMPLAMRTLPDNVTIRVEDGGIGMSRNDLQAKFLIAGRRRRDEDKTSTTDGGRAVMGRKGLGKLAGFGVAKRVTVFTREKNAKRGTKIVLDYDDLAACKTTDGIIVPESEFDDAKILPNGGTLIELSRLMYDPTKSRETTIENEIGDHFAMIDPADFKITVNSKAVVATPRKWDYAWPNPDKAVDEYVTHDLIIPAEGTDEDETESVQFRYRLRFTEAGAALRAAQRGIRVYANKRLAAAPSLLDADTNMHGFRMTDYLDGVVHADFIDQQPLDYISTDRHGLRWEAPMLAVLREFLSSEIKDACKAYQKVRDAANDKKVKDDAFTKQQIESSALAGAEKKLAMKVARALGRAYENGVKDPAYQSTLPSMIQAIGHGGVLTAISKLANQDSPQLTKLVVEITKLTKGEMESFTTRAKARLTAIKAMKKVVTAVDFRGADNEKEIQKLFENSPWLVDATYTQFLSADKRMDSVIERLAQELNVAEHGDETDSTRPDLVFLVGNTALGRLVIIELKSANKYLDSSHLEQLEIYMQKSENWLKEHKLNVKVEGHLIGSLAPSTSRADKVLALRRRIEKAGPTEPWRVRDYIDVLTDTEAAHKELLDVQAAHANDHDDEEDDEAD